jgi:hypothetical protein
MKKTALLFLLAIIIQYKVSSQSCLPDGINLTTQSMIDNFVANYPSCNIIEGNVIIAGEDITNLNGLNSLTGIEGDLQIYWNPTLTSISGLSNLTYVGGFVEITENALLTNFNGLNSLVTIDGYLDVELNDQLSNIEGFASLTTINGDLQFILNENLENLNGLSNLASIGGFLVIYDNNSLTSLSGLNNVSSTVTDINIYGNDLLTDITSLHNINSISSSLKISNNYALNNLLGIESINLNQLQHLEIKNNTLLSECETQNICNYLSDSIGTVYIVNNAVGCNSQYEVQLACLSGVSIFDLSTRPIIFPNPTKDILSIDCSGNQITEIRIFTQIGSEIIYSNSNFKNIDVSSLKPGIYIIEINLDNTKIREKLIKE